MVTLSQINASNSRVAAALPAGLVAVFAGATSGIGEHSLRLFAKHALRPRIYFIGRSQEAGDRILKDLKALNAEGTYTFIPADMSLLKNVDQVCRDLEKREQAINLLYVSQGTARMGIDTSEGLPYLMALTFYSRVRLISNLLPLIRKAQHLRRVDTVLAGGKEGKMYVDDIPGRKVSFRHGRGHLCSITTLALEAMARNAPEVTFIHNFPGSVKSNLIRPGDGFLMQVASWYFQWSMRNKWMDNDECGERHTFFCTSAMYPPKEGRGAEGVPLVEGCEGPARGIDGAAGSGVYTIGEDGETGSNEALEWLRGYREQGMVERVWEHTEGEFRRIVGSTSVASESG